MILYLSLPSISDIFRCSLCVDFSIYVGRQPYSSESPVLPLQLWHQNHPPPLVRGVVALIGRHAPRPRVLLFPPGLRCVRSGEPRLHSRKGRNLRTLPFKKKIDFANTSMMHRQIARTCVFRLLLFETVAAPPQPRPGSATADAPAARGEAHALERYGHNKRIKAEQCCIHLELRELFEAILGQQCYSLRVPEL